jgi:hypothetical protein
MYLSMASVQPGRFHGHRGHDALSCQCFYTTQVSISCGGYSHKQHTQFRIGNDSVFGFTAFSPTEKEEKAYRILIHTIYNVIISKSPDTAMWPGTSQQAGQGTLESQRGFSCLIVT